MDIYVFFFFVILLSTNPSTATTSTGATTAGSETLSSTSTYTSGGTTTTSASCKIDIVYVIERCYYTRSAINDINGFFADLTEELRNNGAGVDLKVAYLIYDSNIDYEKPFISNLTQVKLELEAIPISYSSSYYAKMALEYAYFEFVKIKNGKRLEEHTYYVLLSAYKSSSYPAAGIGTTIRTFNKNKMFAVGWLPSTALESDLLTAVGDSSHYFAINSIASDLVHARQSLLQKLLTCPTAVDTPILPNCKLDVAFIVENSYYTDTKYTSTFMSEIMNGIDFSSGNIQVAVVTYTSTAVTLFNLNMYNSSDELRQAIEAMPSTSSYSRSLNVGLEHARDNIFTSANGDRADAWNYYIFTGTGSSNTDSIGREIRSSGNAYLFALDIGSSYATEWKATIDDCGDESRYIYVSGDENLYTIRSNVTSMMTTCPQLSNNTNSIPISPSCKIDLVFILDDTTSISIAEFDDQLNFFINFMKNIELSDDGIRVALVTYGNNGFMVFSLAQYNTSAEVQTAIANIARSNSAYSRSYRYADRAIEYASEVVFLEENGDRVDAIDVYILLTHGYDYGTVEDYVPVLTLDPNNKVFIIVVAYSSYAVYQTAVGPSNLFIWPDFSSLTCNRQNFLTNFTQCATTSPLPVNITTPDCKLDIVFILEQTSSSKDEKFLHLKYFFADLASQINVSPTTVRIAAITFNNNQQTVFNLNTYSTSAEVAYAIKKIPDEDSISYNYVDDALAYAASDIFTVANGDRADADNFYVFSIDSSRSGTATEGELIRRNVTNHIFAVDIASGYPTEWKNTVGDEQKYFYVSSYSALSAVQSEVLAAITTCQIYTTTTQPTTTTTAEVTTQPTTTQPTTTTDQLTTTYKPTTATAQTTTTTMAEIATTTTQPTTTTPDQLTTTSSHSTINQDQLKTTTTDLLMTTTSQPTTTTDQPTTTTDQPTTTTDQPTTTTDQFTTTTAQQMTTTTTEPTTTTTDKYTTSTITTLHSTTSPVQLTTTTSVTSPVSVPVTSQTVLATTQVDNTTTQPLTTATLTTSTASNSQTTTSQSSTSYTTITSQQPNTTTESTGTTMSSSSAWTTTTTTTTIPTTTTEQPIAGCGTESKFYPDYSSIISNVDNDIGRMYLLNDSDTAVSCCGRISEWEVDHHTSGFVEFMVWRPIIGGKYKLVGMNSFLLNDAGTTNVTVLQEERIAVLPGDVIGWRCAEENLIMFKDCSSLQGCPTHTGKTVSPRNLVPGTEFNWTADSAVISGAFYVVKFTLENNTANYFPSYNISVKDHIKIGGYVANLGLKGVDYMESITYQILPDPLDVNDTWKYFSVNSEGILRTTRRLLPSRYLDIYRMIVTADDSCGNTASVSLDISAQNWV
ncbi:collagen alpha-3(VI) chain isoform X2 [Magallana gigas]|uniref:collagen alpha-3(VI) chain isoform X2 n=1 Tax=Magallana gigas TaxID=29159 RepID=UPI0033410455